MLFIVFTHVNKNKNATLAYLVLMISYLIMILGITYQNIGLMNNQYNSQLINSMIVMFSLFFVFSGGIKNLLIYLLAPYSLFILLIVFKKNLDLFSLSQLFNPSIVLIIIIVLAHIIQKHEFATFKMRKKLENNEKNLKEEVARRKKLEEKLKKDAVTDELTKCYNRKATERILNREFKLSQREKSDFSICYIDINDLKIVNDQQGHKEGDKLISGFSSILLQMLRTTDFVFRVGGDEFVCFLKNCSHENAIKVLDKINKECINQKISFSYGLASKNNNTELSIEELISLADKEMYENKKTYKLKKKTIYEES